MKLDYKVVPLPAVWPAKQTTHWSRRRSPFKQIWTATIRLLDREIQALGGRSYTIAIDVGPEKLRQDGMLRADARPGAPSVIVSFKDRHGDQLTFPCDTFLYWQDNVKAVALALEALRKVDRYGVQQGRQYAGFKAIPATTSGGPTSVEVAAGVVAMGQPIGPILANIDTARAAVRLAMRDMHPDNDGHASSFDLVLKARRRLEDHFGQRL